MDAIQSYSLAHTGSSNVNAPSELIKKEELARAPDAKLEILSQQEEQAIRERQLNEKVETLVEFNGKTVAAFGADGFKTFFSNGDGALANRFNPQDKEGIIAALQEKYGGQLEVSSFDEGSAPTRSDIYQRTYGNVASSSPINIFA